jgi:hypothetical protein
LASWQHKQVKSCKEKKKKIYPEHKLEEAEISLRNISETSI